MTSAARNDRVRKPGVQALLDISQILGSAESSDERVHHALEMLRKVVPYERCALLHVPLGREPTLLVLPAADPERMAFLLDTLTSLFNTVVGAPHRGPPDEVPERTAVSLAVPIIGLDERIGMLFVQSPGRPYTLRHLRNLSLVATQLGAYLSLLQARGDEAQRARELEKARDASEAANRAKDAVHSLVTRELKAPLYAALEGVRVLGGGGLSEAQRARTVGLIEDTLRGQTKLIDDLIDLSRLAAAGLKLDPQAIEPARWIRTAIAEHQPQAERRSISLEAILDPSLHPLFVDPERFEQIVSNLVANAIQFTPDGGRIEVRLERAGAFARLRVIDNGDGIRAAFLPQAFECFSTNGLTKRPHTGLGAGLAIVKSLAELHGGRVFATSEGPGTGATFTVELPLP